MLATSTSASCSERRGAAAADDADGDRHGGKDTRRRGRQHAADEKRLQSWPALPSGSPLHAKARKDARPIDDADMTACLAPMPIEEDPGRHDLDPVEPDRLALFEQVDFRDADRLPMGQAQLIEDDPHLLARRAGLGAKLDDRRLTQGDAGGKEKSGAAAEATESECDDATPGGCAGGLQPPAANATATIEATAAGLLSKATILIFRSATAARRRGGARQPLGDLLPRWNAARVDHDAIHHDGWRRHYAVSHDLLDVLDLGEVDRHALRARRLLHELHGALAVNASGSKHFDFHLASFH